MGLENEFETAVVNEASVFEPLKVYCIWLKETVYIELGRQFILLCIAYISAGRTALLPNCGNACSKTFYYEYII